MNEDSRICGLIAAHESLMIELRNEQHAPTELYDGPAVTILKGQIKEIEADLKEIRLDQHHRRMNDG